MARGGLHHHAKHRLIADDQADHHRKFAIAGDEIFGAIERIDDPDALFLQSPQVIFRFFGEDAILWKRAWMRVTMC